MNLKNQLKLSLRNRLFQSFFSLDRLGVHVFPKHYYSPMPDFAWLRDNQEAWVGPSSMRGVRMETSEQLAWLEETCADYYKEVGGLKYFNDLTAGGWGPGFGPIESQVLHCFIRKWQPRRVIEIGSGVSTMCMLRAGELNCDEGGIEPKITCIEPYPREALRKQEDRVRLVTEVCQKVPTSIFSELSEGDLLFIDSSHAVKVGSDVVRIYLDILPQLAKGVIVHIHDIYLPYLYPRSVFQRPYGWQETALLLALLTNNDHLSVLCCQSLLHYSCPELMRKVLTDYVPAENHHGLDVANGASGHFPASTWLRTR